MGFSKGDIMVQQVFALDGLDLLRVAHGFYGTDF